MERTRLPELDGLRGLAILMVLVYHVACYTVAPEGSFLARLSGLANGYWSGVDLFFVLSGFLIGGILLDHKQSPNYYRVFYLRRFYRIMPIYGVLLGSFLLIRSTSAGVTSSALFESVSLWPYPVFLQNVFMAAKGSFGPVWLAATWSLCIEEQFYLTLPFIVRRLERKQLLALAVGLIVMACLLRVAILTFSPSGWLSVYVLLPCRMDSLLIGVLIAMAFRSERAKTVIRENTRGLSVLLAIMAINFQLLMLESSLESWFIYLYNEVMFGVLLTLLVFTDSPLRAIFRLSPLRRLGDISYGLYLIHPVILFLTYWLIYGREYHVKTYTDLCLAVGGLMLSAVIAFLSWRYFEMPLQRIGRRAKYERAVGVIEYSAPTEECNAGRAAAS